MLHLHPELVRMHRARDFELSDEAFERYIRGQLPKPPPGGAGVVGHPTAATADKGERIYRRIIDAIRQTVFIAPGSADTDL
jgi:creatinine amidohydrolase/Fe(II)-dependent formamide hydrolase-like protein